MFFFFIALRLVVTVVVYFQFILIIKVIGENMIFFGQKEVIRQCYFISLNVVEDKKYMYTYKVLKYQKRLNVVWVSRVEIV